MNLNLLNDPSHDGSSSHAGGSHAGDLTAAAEAVEAEFMLAYATGTPAPARAALGIATRRIASGVAISMPGDPTRYWSKAVGFGFDQPVTSDLIAEVIDFYLSNGDSSATIQIAPSVLPDNWSEICTGHGLRPGALIQKLAGPIGAVQLGQSRLQVDEVDADSVREWASVTLKGFGMPEQGLADMLAASLENDAFRPFAARNGDRIVAGGNLFVHGEIGSLNSGSTLPGHRGRGAQSALLSARAKAAAAADCRWLVAETGQTGSSLNNMLRAGLNILYPRQNWLWHRPT